MSDGVKNGMVPGLCTMIAKHVFVPRKLKRRWVFAKRFARFAPFAWSERVEIDPRCNVCGKPREAQHLSPPDGGPVPTQGLTEVPTNSDEPDEID